MLWLVVAHALETGADIQEIPQLGALGHLHQPLGQPRCLGRLAGPFTAAIIGTSTACMARGIRWIPLRWRSAHSAGLPAKSPLRLAISRILPPALNADPAPVITSTDTSWQWLTHSAVVTMSSIRWEPVRALRRSCRFRVSTATPFSRVSRASVSWGKLAIVESLFCKLRAIVSL